ncbi:Peritrophin-44 [Pseudolycoriella hygida]|uniref:Peritrophin-44 n=1 Tax=Pseudolycoriella hygida TaxID=35572 RepID=A0A9Q0N9V6_9DIPT|nr:Peritrophin-44 [Pseudolycoriella hygida]
MLQQVFVFSMFARSIFAVTSSICAEVPDGYFVRSSQSCNSYNHCTNGQASYGMCPKGFSFNPLRQICDQNIEVDCQLCSPYGIQNIPHPDSCAMYYRCVKGKRKTMTCPDELLFDRYFGDCNFAQRVICETKNTICQPFRDLDWLGAILIGNPLDCSSYYYCISGKAIEAVCPSGLSYNPYTATCEVLNSFNFCQGIGPIITTPIPERTTRQVPTTQSTPTTTVRVIYVTRSSTNSPTTLSTTQVIPTQSTSSTTTTTPPTTIETTTTTEEITTEETTTEETTTEDTVTEDTTTEETTTEETTTEETTTISTPPAPVSPSCEAGVTGYFPMPEPNNCTRYYYCSRGVMRYTYVCAPGLFFTPGNDRCTADVPPGCEYLVE